MKRCSLFLSILALLLPLWSQEYRIVPNYGHIDRVSVMEIDEKRDILISLGADNSCLVTDLKHSRVTNRFSFTGNLVSHALNGSFPEIALMTERKGVYTLTAFNWQTGKVLFSRILNGIPFYLEYAQTGDILMFGNNSSRINMVDHRDGSPLDSPSSISSLLTFGYMGGTAKTFMGYSPSGQLIYYDRFSSQIKGTVTTGKDLTGLGVVQNDIQYITARKDNSIFLINRQTGQESDLISFDNLISFHNSPREGVLTLLYEEENVKKVTLMSLSRGKFRKETTRTLNLPGDESILTAVGYDKKIYLGTESGDILQINSSGKTLSLFSENILKIDQLVMGNNRLITGNSKEIWEWESPFFEKDELEINHILNIRRRVFDSPYENIGLAVFQEKGVLWSGNKDSMKDLFLFSQKEKLLDPFYTPLPVTEGVQQGFASSRNKRQTGISQLSYLDDREIIFLWDKTCLVNGITQNSDSTYSRQELFRQNHPSYETAAMISRELLVIGKNTYYGGNSSLNVVNIMTGETLYMEDDRELITQILPVDGKGRFYTLGYKKEGSKSMARIGEHSIEGSLVTSREIYSYEEEITNQSRLSLGEADFSDDKGIKALSLYLRKQDSQWLRIDKEGVSESSLSSLSPIFAHRGYLYFISHDHSLIIMKEDTMTPAARVYLFENGQWLGLSLLGDYYIHSKEARDLFSVFKLE